jgi:hypothetical protein
LKILNTAKNPAINAFIIFRVALDPTNITANGWFPEPPLVNGENSWRINADAGNSIPQNTSLAFSTLEITNFLGIKTFIFDVGADNADTKRYFIACIIQK